jgi:hypothetical protein
VNRPLQVKLSLLLYTVVDNNASRSMGSQLVDVEINKFWSWMNPGFWAITLSTEIATDIRVNGSDTDKRTIYVKATDHFQAATEGNWLAVMKDALTNYIAEVKTKFRDNQRQSSSGEPLSRILFRPTICLVLLRVIK